MWFALLKHIISWNGNIFLYWYFFCIDGSYVFLYWLVFDWTSQQCKEFFWFCPPTQCFHWLLILFLLSLFYFEPWLPSLLIFSADSVLSECDELVFLFGTYSISSQSLIHLFTIVIFDSCVALVFLSILFNYNCWLDCFSAAQHLLFYACFKNLKLASPKCTI